MATTKKIQLFWLALAALFVAAFIWLVPDSLAVTTVSGAFTGVLGIFLGTDIAAMILKTRAMQPGDYKSINTHRYVIALFIFAFLLIEAVIIASNSGREMSQLYMCFGLGVLVVIGGLINGIECNKICTGQEAQDESP